MSVDAETLKAARSAPIVSVARSYVSGWDRKRTRPAAGDYWACCPLHQEKTASFHVDAGKGVFNCFGCGEGGDAITLVQRAERLGFDEAAAKLAGGIKDKTFKAVTRDDKRKLAADRLREEQGRLRKAGAQWNKGATPDLGSPVRTYLASRGLCASTVALACRADLAIREHHDKRGRVSMLALARDNHATARAVQLTKLKPDGSGKRGDGWDRITTGPLSGATVQLLAPVNGALAICEGVETALAFYQLHRIPTWAALGTANLSTFTPPAGLRRLYIAADGDAAGRAAAGDLFKRLRTRLRCTMALAPDGHDWADVLASNLGGSL